MLLSLRRAYLGSVHPPTVASHTFLGYVSIPLIQNYTLLRRLHMSEDDNTRKETL